MNRALRRAHWPAIAGAILALILLSGMGSRSLAEGIQVQGLLSPQGNAGTAFTYQGRILFNGTPVDNELCSVAPTLWDAESGGTQIASSSQTIVRPDHGFFKMDIDFGHAFTGAERWLQLHVACVSDPNAAQGTTLPRIRLAPVPYALGLVPGAFVQDSSGANTAFSATSGPNWTLPLLIATKVAGLWGDSRFNDGVIGTSQQGNGVYGYSETGKAVYADGDAHIEGNLTWKAKRSAVSVSAAAFIPEQLNDAGNVPYDNEGYYLKNESNTTEWFVAPVQLPHGAVVKQLDVAWHDGSDETATLVLRRVNLLDSSRTVDTMGSVVSVGDHDTVRDDVRTDDTIDFATIDNELYTYYLEVRLPPNAEDIKLHGVTILYEITGPY
ncbi:MAG: hypothetical protein D6775_12810 [Caldilineae bacterium]|nr:MAG: hypothetical protein D6775_12810 [Caldilineae bacterium]